MNRLPRYLVLTAIFLLLQGPLWGQLEFGLDESRHLEYLRSIKQLSEFIDRFNQDSYEVPDLDPGRSRVLDRKQSIILLFNRNDPRFDLSSPEYSDAYVELVLKFAEDIVENGVYLNKHSDQIQAVVTASVLYKGVPDTVRIILTQEVDTPNLVRWVIADVEADFLEIPERDTTLVRFLSPVSHELGFMDLKKAFGEPEHLIDYVREDYVYDRLGTFLYAVRGGDLIIKQLNCHVIRFNIQLGYVMILTEMEQIEGNISVSVLELDTTLKDSR
ncbi:MAG: hypothetical protein V2B15_03510 [Bacteroidota bacterium]